MAAPKSYKRFMTDRQRPKCKHCHLWLASYGRKGLCHKCGNTPSICKRYSPVSKYGRRGNGSGRGGDKIPGSPTKAIPGTEGKILVMQQRVIQKTVLFHPQDADFFGSKGVDFRKSGRHNKRKAL
jgi:hypothetical protein